MTARYQIPKLSGKANYSGEFDVVVCGGGSAGVVAAIAATREGVKVLLAAVPFMFEPCKRVLEELALREGVNIRYFTTFLLPKINHNRIEGLFLHGKSGISYVKTSAVVDATGDADVAFRSGCPTVKGRKEDGLMTPDSAYEKDVHGDIGPVSRRKTDGLYLIEIEYKRIKNPRCPLI